MHCWVLVRSPLRHGHHFSPVTKEVQDLSAAVGISEDLGCYSS